MRGISYKKKVLKKIISIIITTYLEWYTRQSCPVFTHLSQGLVPPILTVALLWYFFCCLPLAFLKSHCPTLSLAVISLCLDPTTWDLSTPFNRAVFSSSTLSQSCWIYSNVLFFFFFSSSTTLYLLASSLAFSYASLLAFWAAYSAQHSLTAFSSWSRYCCFSLCLHCISCHWFSKISASFCEMLEEVGEDMMIQKQE